MDKKTNTKYEEMTLRFFQIRFPEKDIKFEKECGYFETWVKRFESGNPEHWADDKSILAISQIKTEFSNLDNTILKIEFKENLSESNIKMIGKILLESLNFETDIEIINN